MIQRDVRCRGVADRAARGPYRGNDRVVGSALRADRTIFQRGIRCIVVGDAMIRYNWHVGLI